MSFEVKKGYLALYYCFDIAEEITIEKIEKIFGNTPQKLSLQYSRLAPPYLQYREPPLFVSLGTRRIGDDHFACDAKIYDFGVVTIRLSLPIVHKDAETLVHWSKTYVENTVLEKFAREMVQHLKKEIGNALIELHMPAEEYWENYAVFCFHELKQEIKGADFLTKHRDVVARLVKGEKENLSTYEKDNALKYFISYYENDIAIVDWNAAVVVDPQKGFEVLDVLEYAVIELLELRAYDSFLDTVLDKAYDDLKKKRVKRRTLHTLSQVRLDIADVVEKVENALKLIGDLYLAKVYQTASSRFYLEKWKQSVKQKLDTVESLYQVLYDRKQSSRMMFLEVLMTLFFLIDLVFLFVQMFVLK